MKNVLEIVSKELAQEVRDALPANQKTGVNAHPQHDGGIKLAVRINGYHHVFAMISGVKFNKYGMAEEASDTAGIIKHHMRNQKVDDSMVFDLVRPDSIDGMKNWVLGIVRKES
jgi:hypothetical protein